MKDGLELEQFRFAGTLSLIKREIQIIFVPASGMPFPGPEIRQSQRRVLQGGEEVNLTRLEYSTLAKKCKLAFLPQNEEFSLIDLV